ncbi:MAG: GNAT family N-acetyltransferase [Bacteroidales bacterium]|nr:GNAT family N-acetyltransferase [Bacteroidales bacterium]
MVEIKRLIDTEVEIKEIVQLIVDSFQLWKDHGLLSSLLQLTQEEFMARTKEGTIFVSMDENGNLLGTITFFILGKDRRYAKIAYLAVSKRARHLGIGTLLINHCFEEARRTHCDYILSDTAVGAYWSIRLHLKSGFVKIGVDSFKTNNYYSVLFKKDIQGFRNTLYYKCRYVCSILLIKLYKRPNGSYTTIARVIRKMAGINGHRQSFE